MYHEYFHGTHYEIGFRWGALLAERGNFILDHIGFPITPERAAFSDSCIPVYQAYFPEILEEIRGISDGQGCDVKALQAFLFSMYAMPPACHCSCLAVSNGRQILFGRNSDFLTELETSNMNVIYGFTSSGYSFTGNTTAFVQMEDGVNEHGLAVGLTSVQPVSIRPGMNAGLLLRFFLETCKTTGEVLERIQNIPISSAQTFTIADAAGEIVVVECSSDGAAVLRPSDRRPYVCAVNQYHAAAMEPFRSPGIDDWQAGARYETLVKALDRFAGEMTVGNAADILSGRHGFLCQYDRKTGRDTVWSVIYDLKKKVIFRVEGNPSRHAFQQDSRFRIL